MELKKNTQHQRTITYTLTQIIDKKDLDAVSGAATTSRCTGGGGTGGGSVDCIIDL